MLPLKAQHSTAAYLAATCSVKVQFNLDHFQLTEGPVLNSVGPCYTSPYSITSQMIYHRGGEPERVLHCWFNVIEHKPWITAEFVTVCCS